MAIQPLEGEFAAVELMLMHMPLEKVLAYACDRAELQAMNGVDECPASFADTIPAPAASTRITSKEGTGYVVEIVA